MSDNADYTQSGPEVKFGVDSGDWRQEFPAELKPLTYCDHWIIWRWEENRQGKRTKVPYQPRQPNRKADTGDVHTWATFAEACSAAQHADGIGFVLTHTDYVAFDIDDCRDAVTGEIHPWATNLIARANSYTEVTVSGTGIRIIGIGTGPELHRKRPVVDGVSCEIYRKATRYIVMTGRQIGNKPFANIDAVIDATQVELDGRRDAPRPAGDRVDFDDVVKNGRYDLFKDEKGKDDRSRAVYYVMNEAVRRGSKDEEIVALLLDRDNRISEHIYDQGNPERFARQQVAKVRTNIESHLVSMNPMQRARQFHSQHFPNLHHWRGTFYEWVDTSHYVEVEVDRLKSVICHWLEPLLIRDEKGKIKPAPTNIAVVTETIAALQAIVHLDGTREAPFWIEDGIHGELIAFPNGLYDWVNDKLYDPSPEVRHG